MKKQLKDYLIKEANNYYYVDDNSLLTKQYLPDYYDLKKSEEAIEKLRKFESLDADQLKVLAKKRFEDHKRFTKKINRDNIKEKLKLEKLLKDIKSWHVTNKDIRAFKNHLIKNIQSKINMCNLALKNDFDPELLTPSEYRIMIIKSLNVEINYHYKCYESELNKYMKKTKWITNFVLSLVSNKNKGTKNINKI